MNRKDRIARAAAYLTRNGYNLAFTSPKRGVDLIVFPKEDPDTAVFVAVLDGGNSKTVPHNPFLGTKKRELRRDSFMKGSMAWMREVEWKGKCRPDAVTFLNDGTLDHCESGANYQLIHHTSRI